MKNKKIYLTILLLFLVCILSISAISATGNTTNKEIISDSDNKESNLQINIQYDGDVSTSKENYEINLEENNNDKEDSTRTETTTENNAELTFTDLNTTINGNSNSTIYLSNNYKYNDTSDNNFKNGISITRDLTVYGNGVTLDGNKMARIFNVTDSKLNVNFYNITFINGWSWYGGAIYKGNAYYCTFIDNSGFSAGGAIYNGNAYYCTFTNNGEDYRSSIGGAIHRGDAFNCTFTNNKAGYGGAIYQGDAFNCTFTGNNASLNGGAIYTGNAYNCIFIGNNAGEYGGAMYEKYAINCTFSGNNAERGSVKSGGMYGGYAILCRFNGDTTSGTRFLPAIINVLNYTSTYESGEKLKFNLTANNTVYDGFNTTIEIYRNGSLVKTVYALTGEGWIVDLEPGKYTAVLRLTDYPDEQPSNATINILENTTVVISPITDVIVGKEITINYTTNSNGTVTIKVNGQPITDGKFTPNTAGIYNVSVEVAENDYYTAATNQTTFKAKFATKITASPVTTSYYISKMLIITLKDANGNPITNELVTVNLDSAKKYKTNSNGQIKIQVGALTPKTYNAKITYEGSDIYNGSTSSVKVTVKKSTPKITANAVKYNGKTKQFKVYFLTGHMKHHALKSAQVSLKVNGKTYTVKTNSKGQGIFNINKLKKGKYSAVLSILSNNYYNKVTKNVIITVKK